MNRVNKFPQGEAQWKEFHFDFGVMGRDGVPASARHFEGSGADDGRDRHADGERTCGQGTKCWWLSRKTHGEECSQQ